MNQAPENGWRLVKDEGGETRLFQIVGGMVHEADVPKKMRDKPLGYYDVEGNLLIPDAEIKVPERPQ